MCLSTHREIWMSDLTCRESYLSAAQTTRNKVCRDPPQTETALPSAAHDDPSRCFVPSSLRGICRGLVLRRNASANRHLMSCVAMSAYVHSSEPSGGSLCTAWLPCRLVSVEVPLHIYPPLPRRTTMLRPPVFIKANRLPRLAKPTLPSSLPSVRPFGSEISRYQACFAA
jgi:hypothetical protein